MFQLKTKTWGYSKALYLCMIWSVQKNKKLITVLCLHPAVVRSLCSDIIYYFYFTVNGFFDQQKSFLSRVIRSSLRYIFFLFKQLQPNCRLVQPMQGNRQWITKEMGRQRKKKWPHSFNSTFLFHLTKSKCNRVWDKETNKGVYLSLGGLRLVRCTTPYGRPIRSLFVGD